MEVEQQVISSCLVDGNETVVECLAAGVTENTFFSPANRTIWTVIRALHSERPPVTMETLHAELDKRRLLAGIGGLPYLMEVSGKVPTTAHSKYFIEKARELQVLRDVLDDAKRTQEMVYAFTGEENGGLAAFLAEREDARKAVTAGAEMGLPRPRDWSAFACDSIPVPPELVAGIAHKGRRMCIAGPAKVHKSWCLLDAAISISTGTPVWGLATTKGRVLLVDFELPAWGLRQRIDAIAEAKRVKPNNDLVLWSLDGWQRDIGELMPALTREAKRGAYSCIILDPVYVLLGDRDENSNSDVTDFLNRLAWLARDTGAAVWFAHHFAKGNAASKEAKDRASGAAAWVRAPDSVLMLSPHEEEGAYTMEFILRNLRKRESQVVRWEHPCLKIAEGLDPAALRKPGAPKLAKNSVANLVELLDDGGSTYTALMHEAKVAGLSGGTFKRLLNEAIDKGMLVKIDGLYRRK